MRRPSKAAVKTVRSQKKPGKTPAKSPARLAAKPVDKAAPSTTRRRTAAKLAAPAPKAIIRAPAYRRLVVGITGASGVIYGLRLLESLKGSGVETHLVLTRAAEMTIAYETEHSIAAVKAMADRVYAIGDVGAAIASGSFHTLGMAVMPCSMKTLAEIATGVTGNLLSRAADVTLKERRRLVLVPRETPLHLGHIRNMAAVTEMGAIVAPPMPGFYAQPQSLDDMINHTVGRVLDLFGLDVGLVKRWAGGKPSRSES
ncbi:UbiX family flavin prenyltransferase [Ferrovibrio sp.]|uniref:UbiX family flavin prenyltransferase n=1 Tax=Ferrovibrio sp. TaxID=1917215 RepID=UPI003510E014